MSTIATTFPDIPRLYTGIAEWASCMLFICFMPRRRSKTMTAAIAAVFLLVQCLFLIVTAKVPLFFWIPCMLTAFGLMVVFLAICMEYPLHISLYYALLALVAAEFMASLGWQIVREVYRHWGRTNWLIEAILMAVTYLLVLASIGWLEKRTLEAQLEVRVQWEDLIPPLIADLFNTRTLIDLGGLTLLYAIRLRLIGIQAQRELERIQTILNAQYEKYRNAREAIDMVNLKYHDLKHQIVGLRAEMDPEKRSQTLAEMEAQLEEYKPERQTGNPVLDAILSGKEAQIRGLGIAFTCVADGALLSPMHVVDICSIFGNALENAIECEATVQERGRRWIHMLVTEKKGFVFAEISNYCEGELLMKDGMPVTSKKDRGLHGYGVRSIGYTARKYGGTATFEKGPEQFTVRILLPSPVSQSTR